MNQALYDGWVGALSVLIFTLLGFLLGLIRKLIKNPQAISRFFKKVGNGIQSAYRALALLFARIRTPRNHRKNRYPEKEKSSFPKRKMKRIVYFVLLTLLIIGSGIGIYAIVDNIVLPKVNTKKDAALLEMANREPALADSLAFVMLHTIHKCKDSYYSSNKQHAKLAIEMIRIGAEFGHPTAQRHLGEYYQGADFYNPHNWEYQTAIGYYSGNFRNKRTITMLGEEANTERAAYWYKQAANQKDPISMVRLGYLYYKGLGVEYDPFKGPRLIRQGADLGSRLGQRIYGDILEKGPYGIVIHGDGMEYIQLEPDIEGAKYYWELAKTQGDDIAKERLERILD